MKKLTKRTIEVLLVASVISKLLADVRKGAAEKAFDGNQIINPQISTSIRLKQRSITHPSC